MGKFDTDPTSFPRVPRSWEELLELRDFLTDCDVSFLRKAEDHKKYQQDMSTVSREEGVKLITDQFQGQDIALIPNKYPHTNLLQYLPNVAHFCLWSLRGSLTNDQIYAEVNKKIAGRKWTWMVRKTGYVSIPEVWHAHIYILQ